MWKLVIVSTPIGNLGDIWARSIDALARCDVILCEDTWVCSKLLNSERMSLKLEQKYWNCFHYLNPAEYSFTFLWLANSLIRSAFLRICLDWCRYLSEKFQLDTPWISGEIYFFWSHSNWINVRTKCWSSSSWTKAWLGIDIGEIEK
jgi:hypothetical protein